MTDAPDQELVTELARHLVQEAAPEELPLFRATSEAYFKDPAKTLARSQDKDEMLGFGAEAVVVLLTPVALEVAKSVVAWVAARVRSAAEREAGGMIDDAVGGLFRRLRGSRAEPEPAAPELSDEELAEVRRVAFEKARQLDLPKAKAELLADSVVGSLATA